MCVFESPNCFNVDIINVFQYMSFIRDVIKYYVPLVLINSNIFSPTLPKFLLIVLTINYLYRKIMSQQIFMTLSLNLHSYFRIMLWSMNTNKTIICIFNSFFSQYSRRHSIRDFMFIVRNFIMDIRPFQIQN